MAIDNSFPRLITVLNYRTDRAVTRTGELPRVTALRRGRIFFAQSLSIARDLEPGEVWFYICPSLEIRIRELSQTWIISHFDKHDNFFNGCCHYDKIFHFSLCSIVFSIFGKGFASNAVFSTNAAHSYFCICRHSTIEIEATVAALTRMSFRENLR